MALSLLVLDPEYYHDEECCAVGQCGTQTFCKERITEWIAFLSYRSSVCNALLAFVFQAKRKARYVRGHGKRQFLQERRDRKITA